MLGRIRWETGRFRGRAGLMPEVVDAVGLEMRCLPVGAGFESIERKLRGSSWGVSDEGGRSRSLSKIVL